MDIKVNSKTSSSLWLDVSDIYGKNTQVSFLPNSQIEKLKELVIKQMNYEDEESQQKHKLVLVNNEPRSLEDGNTAHEEKLEDGDSVLLVKVPSHKSHPAASKQNQTFEPPTAALIMQATETIPAQGGTPRSTNPYSNDNSSTQVEQTLRKVLLALLELSYKFMHFETSTGGSSSPTEVPVDPQLVKQLVDMGFAEKSAKKALIINQMDKTLAMEWLLNHNSDVEDESEAAPSSNEQSSSSSGEPVYKYRARARQFKPNPNHLENLLAMGFSREDAVQALRISGNNPNTACDWLLSDRRVQADVDQSLSTDSELYKALLANPTIHIGLHDPKVVEALEDMVENPWRRNNWAYESAVGNVILQILKLYNKYSMTSNQS